MVCDPINKTKQNKTNHSEKSGHMRSLAVVVTHLRLYSFLYYDKKNMKSIILMKHLKTFIKKGLVNQEKNECLPHTLDSPIHMMLRGWRGTY